MRRRIPTLEPEALTRVMNFIYTVRSHLNAAHPFWGHLLMQVDIVPDDSLPTFAATDCMTTIWVNPFLFANLPGTGRQRAQRAAFILLHEVCHMSLASVSRCGRRNWHLWNCAHDYAINRIVSEIPMHTGIKHPAYLTPDGEYPGLGRIRVLLDKQYDGLSAEAIYAKLLHQAKYTVPQQGIDFEINGQMYGGYGDGIDVHPLFEHNEIERTHMRERLRQAEEVWNKMNRRGSGPGDWLRRIQSSETCQTLPWQQLLQDFISQTLEQEDWCHSKPNKRLLRRGFIAPGQIYEPLGSVVVAIDSSGSITRSLLRCFLAEINAIRKHASVTLIVADSKIQEVVQPEKIEEFIQSRRLRGGGGTDHRCVFNEIRRRGIQPDVFIGLTDLYSHFPTPPPYPVIWVTPEQHRAAPWGHQITISNTKKYGVLIR